MPPPGRCVTPFRRQSGNLHQSFGIPSRCAIVEPVSNLLAGLKYRFFLIVKSFLQLFK